MPPPPANRSGSAPVRRETSEPVPEIENDQPLKKRLRLVIRGAVQGVGFRPFVYRLAKELNLSGWVQNAGQGVCVELEGAEEELNLFLLRLPAEKPERSHIQSLEPTWLDPTGCGGFQIRDSDRTGPKTAYVQADIATCGACLQEMLDPANRRFLYPFINCTHCGPRFTIIKSLPYDRANTTMSEFAMCEACRAEYENPLDRRFHAQPNACPVCGPNVELWDRQGKVLTKTNEALTLAAAAMKDGQIVAVKGVGGFHLLVSAGNDSAVVRLRERKHREEKPFALLFPSLEHIRRLCEVSPLEQRLLESAEAPIVLLRRLKSGVAAESGCVCPSVAPGNPALGVMLPSTPLHHLLMRALDSPVVATSGNLSDEPLCTDEHEALRRLGTIADLFLVHNRPIVRHVDDSIARVVMGREMLLRRARGYAPLPIPLNLPTGANDAGLTALATGAQLKSTVALCLGRHVFLSQHLGDLETRESLRAYEHALRDLPGLYGTTPDLVACDTHPDYASTRSALSLGKELATSVVQVQHHEAHVLACMAENELAPPVLGVSWDGTGYGLDGAIWGGEFFLVEEERCVRVAHLRAFPLPGGEQAIREPRRAALGLLYAAGADPSFTEAFIQQRFSESEAKVIRTMLARGLNCPMTTSVGRLFDAVASITGIRQITWFEGQAAMGLEFAAENHLSTVATDGRRRGPSLCSDEERRSSADATAAAKAPLQEPPYCLTLREQGSAPASPLILDWAPLVASLIRDVQSGLSHGTMGARFHDAMARSITDVASKVGCSRVALSGGCFQNRLLTETTVMRLQASGFKAYWHQRVPPNDGGICLGQIVAAYRRRV